MLIPHDLQHFFLCWFHSTLVHVFLVSHYNFPMVFFLFLFPFCYCPFIFCCCFFSFITGISITSHFDQTDNTSLSSSKYFLKTSIRLPRRLVSIFGEPRCCIFASQSPNLLSINYFSKFPQLQLTYLHPLFFLSNLMISGDIVPNKVSLFLVAISTSGLEDIFILLSFFINFLICYANFSPVNSYPTADHGWCQSSQPRPNTRIIMWSFIASFLPLMLVVFLSSL